MARNRGVTGRYGEMPIEMYIDKMECINNIKINEPLINVVKPKKTIKRHNRNILIEDNQLVVKF
mgnify:CR=1 FL=1